MVVIFDTNGPHDSFIFCVQEGEDLKNWRGPKSCPILFKMSDKLQLQEHRREDLCIITVAAFGGGGGLIFMDSAK